MSFDVNYAPVLDVDTNPQNPVIGDRSFGRDAALVAELGAAFIEGHEGAGVGACGKHFPGHGDTDTDSHLELPAVHHDLERLRRVEWPPFRAAVGAGVGAIMTAHVVASALDHETPATLSRPVLSCLREELGFDGVIISDDLEMKAIAGRFTTADVARAGLHAGVDVFLACKTPELIVELYRDLVHAAESGDVSHETLLATERRTTLWRQRFVRPPVPWAIGKHDVGALAHLELSRRLEA